MGPEGRYDPSKLATEQQDPYECFYFSRMPSSDFLDFVDKKMRVREDQSGTVLDCERVDEQDLLSQYGSGVPDGSKQVLSLHLNCFKLQAVQSFLSSNDFAIFLPELQYALGRSNINDALSQWEKIDKANKVDPEHAMEEEPQSGLRI